MNEELKPVIIVTQNEVIKAAYDELMEVKSRCDERFKFVKKQVDSIEEEKNKAIEAFWEVSEKELKEKGIVKGDMPLQLTDGVIYEGHDNKPRSLPEFLAMIFGKKHE